MPKITRIHVLGFSLEFMESCLISCRYIHLCIHETGCSLLLGIFIMLMEKLLLCIKCNIFWLFHYARRFSDSIHVDADIYKQKWIIPRGENELNKASGGIFLSQVYCCVFWYHGNYTFGYLLYLWLSLRHTYSVN